ncbi:MAG: hypothetical protein ACFBWO_18890 [Paracoccaceae bacterium]
MVRPIRLSAILVLAAPLAWADEAPSPGPYALATGPVVPAVVADDFALVAALADETAPAGWAAAPFAEHRLDRVRRLLDDSARFPAPRRSDRTF